MVKQITAAYAPLMADELVHSRQNSMPRDDHGSEADFSKGVVPAH
jgi:hypothetical protein